MVPIQQGIIQTHFQPFSPERLHVFPDQVPAAKSVGGFVVGQLAVEQAESIVVLGGKNRVFHPGLPGQGRPNLWVILARIELLEIRLVSFGADALNTAHPFPLAGMEYKPQWMNMPNRSDENQRVRSLRAMIKGFSFPVITPPFHSAND